VYAFIRTHNTLRNEDPKDLTQGFLIEVLSGTMLQRYRPERGAFRSYLLGAVQLYLSEQRNRAAALKRGGGRAILRLDEDETRRMEEWLADWKESPETAYELAWAHSVLENAIAALEDELRQSGKEQWFQAYRRYEIEVEPDDSPTYQALAVELGVTVRDVGNYLTSCKKRLRELVRDAVQDTVDDPAEILPELHRILRLIKG